jgi:hypothetical protein
VKFFTFPSHFVKLFFSSFSSLEVFGTAEDEYDQRDQSRQQDHSDTREAAHGTVEVAGRWDIVVGVI